MTGNTSLLTAVPAIPTNHSLSAAAIGVPTAAAVPGVVPAVVAAAVPAVVPSAGTVPAPLAQAVPAPLPGAGTVPAPLPPAAGVQGLPAAGVQVLPASARVVEVNEFLEVNIYFYCMHVLLLYRKNTKTYF